MVPIESSADDAAGSPAPARALRADARRNADAILAAAKRAFAAAGVDAPVRDIAAAAGVGMGTLYRHFPTRADLIAGVFRKEVDACAHAGESLAAQYPPSEALHRWMQLYAAFIGTKRGLASALHSGDPTYAGLPGYFEDRLVPALQVLLDTAVASGEARPGIAPLELLGAVGCLGMRSSEGSEDQTSRMVNLLVDGIRFGAEGEHRAAKASG